MLQVRALFELYDADGDKALSLNELTTLLQDIGNKITALPAVRGAVCLARDPFLADVPPDETRCMNRQRKWPPNRAST